MSRGDYEQAVRRIVRRPATISTIVSIAAEQQHRLLSSAPEALRFGEIDLLLECEFEAELYYLPTALNYVEQMREEWDQVAWKSLQVVNSRQYELNALGIYKCTVDRIIEVFVTVTSQFEVRPNSESAWASVVGGSGRVHFVNSIFKFDMPAGDSTLFHTVMERWFDPSGPWQRSATFLDFFMDKDWSPVGHLKTVFSSSLVKSLRQDKELLRRHWALAEAEIKRLCPPDYCEYLCGEILR